MRRAVQQGSRSNSVIPSRFLRREIFRDPVNLFRVKWPSGGQLGQRAWRLERFPRLLGRKRGLRMTVHECAGLARLATKSVLATWMLASIGVAFAQQNWQQIPIPPLPKFAPAQPTRVQLANGMVIFLQEDHELPLISATALIKGGASTEPAEKT